MANKKIRDIAPDTVLDVVRQWGDSLHGKILYSDIWDLHIDRYSGGYGSPAPRPGVYCRIYPWKLIDGEVACSGMHDYSKGIKVLIQKKDNPRVYARLKELAAVDARAYCKVCW